MDSDRKSTVSSFYGGRKGSMDALNSDFPKGNPASSPRHRDDASSFFNPEPMDHMNTGRVTPGYNPGTFFPAAREAPVKGGRDEEEPEDDAWDVYADFNNAGPRYSTAFTQGGQGYQQILPTTPKDNASTTGPVEMVTVPALGPEWKREELHNMTKSAKRERKNESRSEFWKQWRRGQRGLCGQYFTRKVLVIFLFGLCCIIAAILAVTIPRVPSITFTGTPLANATGSWKEAIPASFSRVPANFSFPAFASIQVDTNSNILPIHFTHLRASVYDLDTNRLVGTGDLGKRTLPAKSFPDLLLPLNFTYTAANTSDQTWTNWYNGCKNAILSQDRIRPAVQFRIVFDMDIVGLTSSRSTSTSVTDASCPIELPVTI